MQLTIFEFNWHAINQICPYLNSKYMQNSLQYVHIATNLEGIIWVKFKIQQNASDIPHLATYSIYHKSEL